MQYRSRSGLGAAFGALALAFAGQPALADHTGAPWGGLYVGAHAGYASGDVDWT
ncbi:MAG: hypothetical protein ACT4OU_08075 [Hyphomicrobium sp.]